MDDQGSTTVAVKEFLNSKSTYISLKTKKQILEYIEKLEETIDEFEETIDDLERKLADETGKYDRLDTKIRSLVKTSYYNDDD